MKIRKLILLSIFATFLSCGTDDIENFGLSDCAAEFTNHLDELERNYQDSMSEPDSQGNDQSLEACLNRRNLTEDYLSTLIDLRGSIPLDLCTDGENNDFKFRINRRRADLEEDLVEVWSQCEDIFGGD